MKHLSEENIARYAEALAEGRQNSLPPDIRDHIKECDKCADEVMEVYEMLEDASLTRNDDRKKKKGILMRPAYWLSVAAGITVLVGVGGYFVFYKGKPSDTVEIADEQKNIGSQNKSQIQDKTYDTSQSEWIKQQTDTPKSEPEKQPTKVAKETMNTPQIAEAYQQNERLELLASRFDGEAVRGEGFELTSPHTQDMEVGESVVISWVPGNNQGLIFSLYDNKEQLVFERTGMRDGITIKKDLEPGLYYWKLINQDFDLLYCGKLKVK